MAQSEPDAIHILVSPTAFANYLSKIFLQECAEAFLN
ncbi:hypothetical protein CYA_1676 [Synechococcus sp. JA-3-3Ab]|nr:hypothetical protein CYA_1676 [Synechococcus sp. JA-3-3Ab]